MLLKVRICDELPQWILETDKAAYNPLRKTIYIRRDLRFNISIWIHELGHYFIDICTFGNHKAQMLWERIWINFLE